MELERPRPIYVAALGTDKNGGVFSGHGFGFQSFGGIKGFLCFEEKDGLEQGSPQSPKLGTLLIKTFFLLHQLLCHAYVPQQTAKFHFSL